MAGELAALKMLDTAARRWSTLEMTGAVLDRARGRFPAEPVRTLDALHLASFAVFRDALGPVTLLSFDERIRANARAMGSETAP